MTTKRQNDSGARQLGTTLAANANGRLDPDLEQLVATLPLRVSHLSRVLYRTRGSTLPRGMRTSSYGPTTVFGALKNTTGSCGTGCPDSAAWSE